MENKVQKKMTGRTMQMETVMFYIYFGLMLFTKGIGLTDGPVYKALICAASLCAVLRLLIGKYNLGQRITMFLLLVLGAVIWRTAGNQAVLICVLLLCSVRRVDLKEAFSFGSVIWGTTFVFQVLRFFFGSGEKDFVIHSKFGLGYVIRWAFGYTHPNVLQIAYVVLVMFLLYSCRESTGKVLAARLLLAAAGAVYVFMYSLSVTGMALFLCFSVILLYCEVCRRRGIRRTALEKAFWICLYPLCAAVSILAPLLLQGRAFDLLNRLLTTRPALTRRILTEYGTGPFGLNLGGLPSVLTLDCSYANLLVYGGYIIFAVIMLIYLGTMTHMALEAPSWENSMQLAITGSIVIAAMSEPFAFNTSYKNLSLLFAGSWLLGKLSVFGEEKYLNAFCRKISEKEVYIRIPEEDRAADERRERKLIPARFRAMLAAAAVLCGLLIGGYVYNTAELPERVYALRSSSDTDDNTQSLYFSEQEIEELQRDPEALVLNYRDAETPEVMHEGKIMDYERARLAVSWFVLAGSAVFAAEELLLRRLKHSGNMER